MDIDDEKKADLAEKIKSEEYWKNLAAKVYKEDVKFFRVVSAAGSKLFDVIVDDKEMEAIDWHLIRAKNWNIHPLDNETLTRFINRKQLKAMTADFWTCHCIDVYVHHKVEFTCKKCECTVKDNTERIKNIEEYCSWKEEH